METQFTKELKEKISNHFSSIFHADDVIKIIESIEAQPAEIEEPKYNLQDLLEMLEEIKDNLENSEIDASDIQLELNYNHEITIDAEDAYREATKETHKALEHLIHELTPTK